MPQWQNSDITLVYMYVISRHDHELLLLVTRAQVEIDYLILLNLYTRSRYVYTGCIINNNKLEYNS